MEHKETKANEPAYPNKFVPTLYGLTKREYFAAMALQGFITKYGVECQEQQIKQAVFIAEFLIEELSKTKQGETKS